MKIILVRAYPDADIDAAVVVNDDEVVATIERFKQADPSRSSEYVTLPVDRIEDVVQWLRSEQDLSTRDLTNPIWRMKVE